MEWATVTWIVVVLLGTFQAGFLAGRWYSARWYVKNHKERLDEFLRHEEESLDESLKHQKESLADSLKKAQDFQNECVQDYAKAALERGFSEEFIAERAKRN